MKSERRKRIEQLYQAALERDPAEHAAFLTAACGDDAMLRREIESLLGSQNETNCFMEVAASHVGARALAADPGAPLVGSRLAHYLILEKIGAGGMGEVYRAHDERLGRDVAIKVLLALSDPAARTRLWREARAAASLNHPNVCQLYEIGEENGVLFLAMELLDGEPPGSPHRRHSKDS